MSEAQAYSLQETVSGTGIGAEGLSGPLPDSSRLLGRDCSHSHSWSGVSRGLIQPRGLMWRPSPIAAGTLAPPHTPVRVVSDYRACFASASMASVHPFRNTPTGVAVKGRFRGDPRARRVRALVS
jgi:hypothetical protein